MFVTNRLNFVDKFYSLICCHYDLAWFCLIDSTSLLLIFSIISSLRNVMLLFHLLECSLVSGNYRIEGKYFGRI